MTSSVLRVVNAHPPLGEAMPLDVIPPRRLGSICFALGGFAGLYPLYCGLAGPGWRRHHPE